MPVEQKVGKGPSFRRGGDGKVGAIFLEREKVEYDANTRPKLLKELVSDKAWASVSEATSFGVGFTSGLLAVSRLVLDVDYNHLMSQSLTLLEITSLIATSLGFFRLSNIYGAEVEKISSRIEKVQRLG